MFVPAHDTRSRRHGRGFALSPETCDAFHHAGMAADKLAIIVLKGAPYQAWLALGPDR